MTETVSQAVARRDSGPQALIKQYAGDFSTVLPSHIKPETWVRLAQGSLKRGKKLDDGRTELEVAAGNNPGVFLASLLDAARLGLEPGTEQYYLTPRKVKGKLEILGIVGYQGEIELIYRAGAVSSVIAEVVYANDAFSYQPGRDELPNHQPDWDAEDRGKLRLVYAFARMRDGATSKVIVLNRRDIERIKKSAQNPEGEYSPWVNHEASMWLKSAVHQLAKWVPTSAEYRREQLRDAVEVQRAMQDPPAVQHIPLDKPADTAHEVLDGEVVDEPGDPEKDRRRLFAILGELGVKDREDRLAVYSAICGVAIDSTKDLEPGAVEAIANDLEGLTRFAADKRVDEVGGLIVEGKSIRSAGAE